MSDREPEADASGPEAPVGENPPDTAASPFPAVEGVLDRALVIVEFLRARCPWDREQTARSLVPHLLEEAHETVDAIHADDSEALREELGDLLLNLAFQVVVAEQAGNFTRSDVLSVLEAKMIRRHPHLFGGEGEAWEAIKARERVGRPVPPPFTPSHSALDGLPRGLDALLRAHSIQEKVAGVGFDWEEPSGALAKVKEELAEVESAAAEDDPDALTEELGDLLFAVVNFARLSGRHASRSLEAANTKFQDRFRALETLARERGVPLPGATLAELDELWDEVKARRPPSAQ